MYVKLPDTRPEILFHLKFYFRPNNIRALSNISLSKKNTEITGTTKTKDIQLKLNGEISKIETISFIDKSGREIKQLPSSLITNLKSQDYILSDKDHLKISEKLKEGSVYVEVSGINKNGEKFSRLSYVNQKDFDNRRIPKILIEVSSRSELIATPGSSPKIIFQVTNNYDYPLRIPFSVQDEKSMLRSLYPEV